ncbi:MAG: hypothetical protein HN404_16390 [Gemmatimonadetes bacterium]|nr:hypothetical protein [Gemmatimonadota bacterium]
MKNNTHSTASDEADLPRSDYGDVSAEETAITGGVGLHEISHWQWLNIGGSDHLDFLHRMCTTSLEGTQPGDCAEVVFPDARGRIVERADVCRIEDAVSWLVLGPGEPNALEAWLDRYIFSESVQFTTPDTTQAMIEVLGPDAEDCLSAQMPEIRSSSSACGVTTSGLVYCRQEWAGVDTIRVAGAKARIHDLWHHLQSASAVPVGETAWQLHRISTGIGSRGAELTDAHNPWEAGLGHTVDLNKGCFIGQEVIARLEAYDKIKQRLVSLTLPPSATQGARLHDEGRDVGYLSSVARRPNGDTIGLGYLRNAQAESGHCLRVDGGGQATVRLVAPLPMQ